MLLLSREGAGGCSGTSWLCVQLIALNDIIPALAKIELDISNRGPSMSEWASCQGCGLVPSGVRRSGEENGALAYPSGRSRRLAR